MLGIQTTNSRVAAMAHARANAKGMSAEKIDATAKDFEAQFISQMLENMFATVDDKNEGLGGGEDETSGKEIYRSMQLEQYGKAIANAGGIGVADYVKRQMLQLQEV